MQRWLARIALLMIVGWCGAASATVLDTSNVVPMMTYVSASSINTSRTSGSYSGVGSLFVSHQSTATTGFGDLCTGALVSSNVVLTAAHCLYGFDAAGNADPVTSVTYYLPSFGDRTASETYSVANFALDPTYSGSSLDGNDVALFTLSNAVDGNHDIYGLYAGDPLSAFARVGTGTVGDQTGTGGGVTVQDYVQRQGNNLYEYYGDQVFGNVSHNVLMFDFDDGTSAHDAFYSIGGASQTGIAGEADSSPGDSGGPTFINGLIAGVTSFGVSLGCGSTGFADPYAGADGRCTNSSIGEIGGDTSVQGERAFIQNYIAANAVPEPSSWAMMIGGFGMVGAAMRRRRTLAA